MAYRVPRRCLLWEDFTVGIENTLSMPNRESKGMEDCYWCRYIQVQVAGDIGARVAGYTDLMHFPIPVNAGSHPVDLLFSLFIISVKSMTHCLPLRYKLVGDHPLTPKKTTSTAFTFGFNEVAFLTSLRSLIQICIFLVPGWVSQTAGVFFITFALAPRQGVY